MATYCVLSRYLLLINTLAQFLICLCYRAKCNNRCKVLTICASSHLLRRNGSLGLRTHSKRTSVHLLTSVQLTNVQLTEQLLPYLAVSAS